MVEAESLFAGLTKEWEEVKLITVVVFAVLADERSVLLVCHFNVARIVSL
jgi:hypothetical protein